MGIVSFFVQITVAVVFSVLCSILFKGLNQSKLKLFVPIQKLTNKLKRKELYSNLTLFVFVTISVGFINYYKLSDIQYGVLFGFCFALRDVIFDTSITNKKK